MKKIIYILLTIFIVKIAGIASEYQPLVVKDRIWWYESIKLLEPSYQQIPIIVGITIGEPNIEEPDWFPCLAVDTNFTSVVNAPLAWLKEKDRKVWVRPNLELYKIDKYPQSLEGQIISSMLGFWWGNEVELMKILDPTADANWNPSNQTEFLLYDFNYKVGDIYEWPWTGLYTKGESRDYSLTGLMKVTAIQEVVLPTNSANQLILKSYTIAEEQDTGVLRDCMNVIESLGVTKGNPLPLIWDVWSWCGFFFAPNAFTNYLAMSCIGTDMYTPVLTTVVDPDGQVIYSNKPFQAGVEDSLLISDINPIEPSGPVYDLHGRKIANPQPGSIYIRNGKKFVVK